MTEQMNADSHNYKWTYFRFVQGARVKAFGGNRL